MFSKLKSLFSREKPQPKQQQQPEPELDPDILYEDIPGEHINPCIIFSLLPDNTVDQCCIFPELEGEALAEKSEHFALVLSLLTQGHMLAQIEKAISSGAQGGRKELDFANCTIKAMREIMAYVPSANAPKPKPRPVVRPRDVFQQKQNQPVQGN